MDTKARRRGLHVLIAAETETLQQPLFHERSASTVACVTALEEVHQAPVQALSSAPDVLLLTHLHPSHPRRGIMPHPHARWRKT